MSERLLSGFGSAIRDAAIVTAVSTVVALGVNGLAHPEGIPLIAKRAYETLVPCPVVGGEVSRMRPDDARLDQATTFLIDARDAEAHSGWHLRDATRLTYDYLEPTPAKEVRRVARSIARSRAQRVAVYGDGDKPDTGEQLAKEIAGNGIKNVFFVVGGAPALRAKRGGGTR